MPFKSKKQKTYLAINEPDVYKKFKKEETMMYGKPMKKEHGGKVSPPARPGKAMVGRLKKGSKTTRGGKPIKSSKVKKPMPSPGLMGPVASGGRVTKRPMGGKVYKVDNSGQNLVQKMYGGKIKK